MRGFEDLDLRGNSHITTEKMLEGYINKPKISTITGH